MRAADVGAVPTPGAAVPSGAERGDAPIVGLVRRLYAALGAGDEATLRELLDPAFVGRFAEGMPHRLGGVREGADAAIRDGWWAIGARFAVLAEPERWIVADDGATLTVLGTYRGRARRGGPEVEAAFAHVWRAAGGRLVALDQVTDTVRWDG